MDGRQTEVKNIDEKENPAGTGLTDEETSYAESRSSSSAEEAAKASGADNASLDETMEGIGVEEVDLDDLAAEPMTESEKRVRDNMARRRKKRRRPSPFKVACFVIVFVIAALIFMGSSFFTIVSIEVEGNDYFSDSEIINMGHAVTGKNLFYRSGSREIVDYLEQSPYIDSAKVSKKLPGTLVITVKEREQAAAIVYNKEYLVIDSNGLLLRKTSTKPKLTILSGIKVSRIELGEKLGTVNSSRFDQALELIQAMNDGDLYFTRIDMSKETVSAYVYDALVCKGTQSELIDAVKKKRLQKILKTLFDKNIKRGTITFSKDGYASFEPTV